MTSCYNAKELFLAGLITTSEYVELLKADLIGEDGARAIWILKELEAINK